MNLIRILHEQDSNPKCFYWLTLLNWSHFPATYSGVSRAGGAFGGLTLNVEFWLLFEFFFPKRGGGLPWIRH